MNGIIKFDRYPEDTEEERYLFAQLAILQRSYEAAAKPYVERLVYIRSMQLRPITVPIEYLADIQSAKEKL